MSIVMCLRGHQPRKGPFEYKDVYRMAQLIWGDSNI